MATSGSYDYSLTASNIITAAYEDLGVIAAGVSVASADSATALVRLNILAKQFQARNLGMAGQMIHQRTWVALPLVKGQQSYLVGPNTSDAVSLVARSMGRTTVSADEAAGQTIISVTALTDTTTNPGTTSTMTATNLIGIETDDSNNVHWSTISSTDAGPPITVTIGAALPTARPATAGNYVWWGVRAQRFPHLESVVLRDTNRQDIPMTVYRNAQDYEEGVADKYADSDPTCLLVEPLRLNTRITLNSQPTDATKHLLMSVWYPAEDYDAVANDIAFPQELYGFLEWELAFRLAPAFGVAWTTDMELNRKEATAIAKTLNPETSDLHFAPGAP